MSGTEFFVLGIIVGILLSVIALFLVAIGINIGKEQNGK